MSLVDGLATQVEVVEALILRETRTRFGAHQMGYLWALIEPTLWVATFAALFLAIGRSVPDGMTIVPFLTTGILPYNIFQSTASRSIAAIPSNRGLLFYRQVRPLDVIAARSVLEVSTLVTVFAVLLGLHLLVSEDRAAPDLLATLLGLGLAGALGGSLGLVLSSLNVYSNVVERIYGPLSRPLFWCSGLFFTAEDLPDRARDILLFNPILHVVECVRSAWFPMQPSRYFSLGYVCWWIVALAALGLLLERSARRRVELS